ncbi:MAG: tyrosinase family protein [Methylocella sp.]
MPNLTRRSVLAASAGTAGIFVPEWFVEMANAQSRVYTRYDVASPKGQEMLKAYEDGVAKMHDTAQFPFGDPRSWTFQFYTHWLPPGPSGNYGLSSQQKAEMVKKVPAKFQPIAGAMWNNCQAHSSNPADRTQFQETYFCPWHRWYVYYLEQIIRFVTNRPEFSLPYWNYLSGKIEDLSIPKRFRDNSSSPLYVANRNPWVNAGERIDTQNPGSLNLAALREPRYIDSPNGSIGFCPQLDGNPHGLVHVYVGTGTNMGNVAYAANDPIFWLHHCNIDRLWESWNRVPGRNNPAWDRKFPFADTKGDQVNSPASGANRVAMLGYQYDSYAAPPPRAAEVAASEQELRAAEAQPPSTLATSTSPIALGAQPVQVALAPQAAASEAKPGNLGLQAQNLAPGRQIYLVVHGLAADVDPNVTYNVYLDLPEGATPTGASDTHYIGTVNFFGAVGSSGEGAEAHFHNLTFNITDTLHGLREANLLAGSENAITLVPAGVPEEGAKAKIGAIELIEQ